MNSPQLTQVAVRRLEIEFTSAVGKPFTRLYFHLVWATWNRDPIIQLEWESRLYECFGSTCQSLQSHLLAAGGVEDHVHLLVQTPPTLGVSELVKRIKGASSHLVTHEINPKEHFRWQGYYGAFTVSGSNLKRVENYITCQKERHAEGRLWHEAEQFWLPDTIGQ